jgi:hypothetical protein
LKKKEKDEFGNPVDDGNKNKKKNDQGDGKKEEVKETPEQAAAAAASQEKAVFFEQCARFLVRLTANSFVTFICVLCLRAS